ncbi:trypsin-like peptidase domain-containing protein [Mycobacterium sp. ITM-2016-00317]|uniref:S1C family serine protease n=1 Tax=Mycobacterium sp. ITM-2016-00317 TaxID=2099694 RepID=UPI00287F7C3D|nr:trypsin-like peptidase domain-containing protein [Mycobacterium sp. ITM-2016-00317]WNG86560.1 trypsin-like peptidase domain-containing protein [Mycobacterium sp. ITM-2016-00317]
MTNDPRYSPTQQPGRQSGYPGQAPGHNPGHNAGHNRPQTGAYEPQGSGGWDWRYATEQQRQAFRSPYDPYAGAPMPTGPGQYPRPGMPSPAQPPKKRPRTAGLAAAAVALAMVSAGIGGGVAMLVHPDHSLGGISASGAAPSVPAASAPTGSVEAVAAKVVPSVVKLEVNQGRSSEEGSGVILSPDGLILTNNHVVATAAGTSGGSDEPQTKVTFSDGKTARFTVIGADPSSDIAVVRAQNVSDLTPISIGSSADLRVGQDVVAIGSPLGLEGTVTTGIISALNRPVAAGGDARNQNTVLDAIQTDAAINPGNSGGALVNMNGELVGVNSAIATMGADAGGPQGGSIGLGFAIPVDQAKRIADEIIKTGSASRASLGVQVGNEVGVDGAKIVEVNNGGAASAAGLPSGVIVTKLDDRVISSADALVAAVRSKAPGDTVTLTFLDPSGRTQSVDVTLGKASP